MDIFQKCSGFSWVVQNRCFYFHCQNCHMIVCVCYVLMEKYLIAEVFHVLNKIVVDLGENLVVYFPDPWAYRVAL